MSFFLNYISAKDTHPAAELGGVASILRNGLRALNIGLGFWCWFFVGFFFLISKENLCFYLSDLRNKTQLMFLASACLG